MTQIATVEEVLKNGWAVIAVARQTACGHDCENCAGCGAQAGTVRATAQDAVGVAVGDKVEVTSDNRRILGVAALVYLLPVVTFLLGYAVGAMTHAALWHVLLTVLWTAAGCIPAVLYDRKVRREGSIRFVITRKL